MKKFENPIIEILKFGIEDIVTTSGTLTEAKNAAKDWLTTECSVNVEHIITF